MRQAQFLARGTRGMSHSVLKVPWFSVCAAMSSFSKDLFYSQKNSSTVTSPMENNSSESEDDYIFSDLSEDEYIPSDLDSETESEGGGRMIMSHLTLTLRLKNQILNQVKKIIMDPKHQRLILLYGVTLLEQ